MLDHALFATSYLMSLLHNHHYIRETHAMQEQLRSHHLITIQSLF